MGVVMRVKCPICGNYRIKSDFGSQKSVEPCSDCLNKEPLTWEDDEEIDDSLPEHPGS